MQTMILTNILLELYQREVDLGLDNKLRRLSGGGAMEAVPHAGLVESMGARVVWVSMGAKFKTKM